MTSRVGNVIGVLITGARYGIEYEIEGVRVSRQAAVDRSNRDGDDEAEHSYNIGNHWRMIDDNSLRNNGAEFVSEPLPYDVVDVALGELEEELLSNPHRSASVRTSVHVHSNITDMTMPQVLCQYLLSIAYEPLMQAYIAPNRRRHLFCLPMLMLPGLGEAISAAWEASSTEQINAALKALQQMGKYCSVSMFRVRDYGTIEYRAHHGTLNMAEIKRWIDVLHRLREEALRVQTYSDIVDLFVMGNHEAVISRVFPDLPKFEDGTGPYISPAAARAGALALLSSAKVGTEQWTCRYRSVPAGDQIGLDAGVMADRAAQVQVGGSSARLEAFAGFMAPSARLLSAVLDSGSQPGTMMFDVLIVDSTSVMFYASALHGTDRYYVVATRKAPTKLTRTVVTMEVH